MSSWGNAPDFRSRRTIAAGIAEPRSRPREATGRNMVGGIASWALSRAVKAHSAKVKRPVYKLLADMGLGSSTWDRMIKCKPIAQSSALKIVKFLGTSVRAVLTEYQQESKL